MNQNQHDPKNPDSAWEEAMSRDFDARVRDLHEAPLDFESVKGKAHKIRRNRRAAVAGGVLAVAAVVTPIAVLSNGGDTQTREPDFANPSDEPSRTVADPTTGVDYLAGRSWHQVDGDVVELPKGDYYEAAVWDDQLVTIQPSGEVFSRIDVWDEDGALVDSVEDAVGFAVSSDTSILTYTTADGDLVARWAGGQETLAENITDSGGGESVGGNPVSVTGTAPCRAESGACLVRVNTDSQGCLAIGSSDVPGPADARRCYDQQDDLLSYSDELKDDGTVCGGVADETGLLWHGCDHEPGDISPDGDYVIGAPSQYDGLGFKEISALDARTGQETGRYAVEGDAAFIWSDVSWTTDGNVLFSAYDGASWHLIAMTPTGEITELTDPVAGQDFDNPYVLIRH